MVWWLAMSPHSKTYTGSNPSWGLSVWNLHVVFVRSGNVGREGLARTLRSNSSQRCSIGLRSGLCAGQSSSSTPNWLIHVFMDLALCTGAPSCWNRKGSSPNCFHKVGSMKWSKISWYAEAFRVPCSRIQWRRALQHCIRRFALHLVMYGLDAVTMETHSMKLSKHCS